LYVYIEIRRRVFRNVAGKNGNARRRTQRGDDVIGGSLSVIECGRRRYGKRKINNRDDDDDDT